MEQMNNPEAIWNKYISIEKNYSYSNVIALYKKLLQKTQHIKVSNI